MGGFSPALELILILSAHMQIRNNPVVKVVVEITFFGKNLHSVDSAHLDLTTMSILSVCVHCPLFSQSNIFCPLFSTFPPFANFLPFAALNSEGFFVYTLSTIGF